MRLSEAQRAALMAVEDGLITHAHPFTWGVDAAVLHVKPRTLQALARNKFIRVEANHTAYWRPVRLTRAGEEALTPSPTQ
jgi:hypothetical protein